MKTSTQEIKEIEKGCGNRWAEGSPLKFFVCGKDTEYAGEDTRCDWNGILCPTCQAKLSIYKEWEAREKEILEIIDEFNINRFLDTDEINSLFSTDYSENELCEFLLNNIKSKIKGEKK